MTRRLEADCTGGKGDSTTQITAAKTGLPAILSTLALFGPPLAFGLLAFNLNV